METLPTELLDQIVQHCDFVSQKSLRPASRTLNNLATPLVFERFYLAPCTFKTSLRDLEALVKCENKLADHIKHLHISADILPNWKEDEFEMKASKHPKAVQEVGLRLAWLNYRELLKQQESWFYQNDTYLPIFKELVSSLPNLKSASVGIALPFEGSTRSWPLWRRLSSKIIVSPDDWIFEEEGTYRHDDNYRALWSTFATLNLLEAIGFRSSFAGITKVEKLKGHSLNNGRLKTIMAGITFDRSQLTFSPQIESRFQTLLGAFDHLTDLNLQIPYPRREDYYGIPGIDEPERLHKLNGDEVFEMLRRAKNLKRLSFEYDSESSNFWEPGEEDIHPLSSLFQAVSNPWPSLQKLRLSVNLPHTLLLCFLRLLAPTLRDLDLRDMCVYDAQALFTDWPKAMGLEKLYIECLWTKINSRFATINAPPTTCIICEGLDVDQPYEKGLKAYLLGRVEDFPRLSGAEFQEDGDGEAP